MGREVGGLEQDGLAVALPRPRVEVLAQEQVPGGNVDHAGDRTASLTGDVEEPVLAGRLAEGGSGQSSSPAGLPRRAQG